MDVRQEVVERFVRYVKIDTQSKEGVEDRYPSTEKQLDLARLLKSELEELGLQDIKLDEHGYVTATLPENIPMGTKVASEIPVVGLLAHLDTYHEVSGQNVNPLIHKNYRGGVIELPNAKNKNIDPKENLDLEKYIGDDIITSDGSTLLGADDKAGIAEIMTFLHLMKSDTSIPHPRVRIGFTPDEEVGNGTKYFDVKAFGAQLAYTLDGSGMAEVEDETFCADTALIKIKGIDVHPGYAKDKMVNAVNIAMLFLSKFPKDNLPETTEKRQDYLHPYQVNGTVSEVNITCLARSFTEDGLKKMENILEEICKQVAALEPRAVIEVQVKESYRNMKIELDKHPAVVERAEDAVRKVGLTPKRAAIRGGTDGARLSFQGLPTPNLSAGGYNFHSCQEWIPVGAMVKSVEVLKALMELYVEKGL